MKLVLPNGQKIGLDESLSYEQKLEVVNAILEEWNDYFREKWSMPNTKTCLDILSTYLCLAKAEDEKNKEDKYVMSKGKVKKLIRGDSRKTNFSDLSYEDKVNLGFADSEMVGEQD